ncbi:ATP-binding cassette domain-containing protein [Actinomadura rupiterrae]|uniref:ATP-binding cassette domain-containing protein n=1 Tax=Actinomadura rupiterrae TaxID=559627 RepID=UPI0020A2DB36|nr:ATP-binding cassette domain-containing protein [Actinomadura rupiterrae]MCP2335661.1 ABC-2 type transport system ATP-binding protein [Actinomadura rupiterrae]
MRPSVVEIRNLRVQSLRDVSLSVGRGETHAVLGGYGSGKTTLLEAVAGHRRPVSGSVVIKGGGPATVWREGGLFPGLTVAEIVDAWRRWTLDPLTRSEALLLTGLAGRAAAVFEDLDGTERRLLDLALALVGRSDVLLLDEPFAGLDAPSASRVRAVLRSLAGKGTAILFTTRDIDEACRADHVTVLAGGLPVPGSHALRAATRAA